MRTTFDLCILALCALAAACSRDGNGGGSGRPDAQAPPDAGPPDGPPTAQTLDFTIIGCPSFDGDTPRCKGPAPLTVSFAPITNGAITGLLWDFGDGTTTFEPFPTHTFALPDSYTVTLLAPDISSPMKQGFVEVTPNPLGGACDVDPQCADGTSCLCGQGAQCPAAFARGLCAAACDLGTCASGAICANLGLVQPAPAAGSTPPAWRTPQCLRACTADADCHRGQRCRSLPASGGAAGPALRWERGCFFPFPNDLGAPCRGPEGSVQDDLCLGGRCADFGTQGMCSADCSVHPCPGGSACASYGDGRKLCVRRCETGTVCGDDPLIACVAPGAPGPLGFTVPAGEPAATYCSPRRCASDGDCAPAGTCAGAPTGHCVRPRR